MYAIAVVSAIVLAAVLVFLTRFRPQASRPGTDELGHNGTSTIVEKDVFQSISPLRNFDWRTTEPAKVYNLKPKYHLTMALEKLEVEDLLAMDKTYLDRVALRREIIAKNADATVRCNSPAEPSALELYHWLTGIYLPRRFPGVYELSDDGTTLFNHATSERLPLRPSNGLEALKLLGSHIDTDFLILLPSSTADDGSPVYHLEAFVTCFPSGFDTSKKLGLPLAGIHAPVPDYASKIGKSMDRMFARLEVGRVVKRSNWTVTTDDVLFRLQGTHLYAKSPEEREQVETEIRRRREQVVPEKCCLRSERQTLHRLPQTKALVFSFKTYLYRMDELRKDPRGAEELAQAIQGLGEGNVPDFRVYKSGIVWGDKVMEYLREGC